MWMTLRNTATRQVISVWREKFPVYAGSGQDIHDAVIVGGGFYGAAIAVYLATRRQFRRVIIVERENELLTRASYCNQARVHNGYHYPRSFTTAYRSRVNLPRFIHDFPDAVKKDFPKLYAIARRNSKVTAGQFERFCREIGAPVRKVPDTLARLFDPRLVEAAYLVEEYAFDACALRRWARNMLEHAGVDLRLGYCAVRVAGGETANRAAVECVNAAGETLRLDCKYVFNCSYSGLNQLGGDIPRVQTGLKHEITEMGLIKLPPVLDGLAITVMDGAFFSVMPFPPRGLHTLSHVRFTPHSNWLDQPGLDPYGRLDEYGRQSRVDRMIRDASRYVPALRGATCAESLFEVKTVLVKNEGDDGRPILFERSPVWPACYSILGGKIDNIYDVLEKLDAEPLLLN
jgi:glycine/D-amino acid oxidase-like deaminating enzyme